MADDIYCVQNENGWSWKGENEGQSKGTSEDRTGAAKVNNYSNSKY